MLAAVRCHALVSATVLSGSSLLARANDQSSLAAKSLLLSGKGIECVDFGQSSLRNVRGVRYQESSSD